MKKSSSLPYGAMPHWAKTGAIDHRNFVYRASAHCALKSSERGGEHPYITLDSASLPVWQEYFERHLGGHPVAFKTMLGKQTHAFTLPEELPQFFDPSFTPTPGWKPDQPKPAVQDQFDGL